MPRSSGRSASRPAPRSAAARRPPPQPVQHAPPPASAPAPNRSGESFLGNIAQGFAFGTGSSVAHRAVDAIMGPRTIQHETVVTEAAPAPAATTNSFANSSSADDACTVHTKAFQDCLNSYGDEISKCQFYMDMLSECRKKSSMMGA